MMKKRYTEDGGMKVDFRSIGSTPGKYASKPVVFMIETNHRHEV